MNGVKEFQLPILTSSLIPLNYQIPLHNCGMLTVRFLPHPPVPHPPVPQSPVPHFHRMFQLPFSPSMLM